MKTGLKIFLGAGAVLAGYSLYRAKQLKVATSQITAKISAIRKLKIEWNTLTISLLADLQLINPTDIGIGIGTAGAVKIKRITFFNRNTGVLIGEAQTDISGIEIEPNAYTVIENIALKIPVLTGLLANMELFGAQKELLAIQLTLSVFGKHYTINS